MNRLKLNLVTKMTISFQESAILAEEKHLSPNEVGQCELPGWVPFTAGKLQRKKTENE